MAHTYGPYLEDIRRALKVALCVRSFPSEVVERQHRPEIEFKDSPVLVVEPKCIARNENERCLIEQSINSTRISIKIRQSDDMERKLCKKFADFNAQRAEHLVILRRKPVEGYDLSFLITNTHLEQMLVDSVIDFLINFIQDIDKEIKDLKIMLNTRFRAAATAYMSQYAPDRS
uniref:Actin-related protein 2/3 complex subunit 4 n=1 Tax=Zooxanthella nutricula TaxID=1333877 RepID=A0A7S2MKM8_9DINO